MEQAVSLRKNMKSPVEQKKAARSRPLWALWASCGDEDEQQECCLVGLVEICSDELCCLWSQLQALSAGWGRVSPPGLSVLGSDAFCSTLENKKRTCVFNSWCNGGFFQLVIFYKLGDAGQAAVMLCAMNRYIPHQAGYQHNLNCRGRC